MSKLHEAPEEIFLQVDPEGDGPGEWDTIDDATWCGERINHNDVRYVRADLVKQLKAKLETYESIISGNNTMLEVAEHREAKLRADRDELIGANTLNRNALSLARQRVATLEADREKLLQLLESAVEVIGRFVSDEGWAQSDMDTMDNIDTVIARMRRA